MPFWKTNLGNLRLEDRMPSSSSLGVNIREIKVLPEGDVRGMEDRMSAKDALFL